MPDRARLTPTARSLIGQQHLLVSIIAFAFIVPHVCGRRQPHIRVTIHR
jgi:hypothetical protein